jgi:pyrroloquinoline quinone biosynthesis protein D
MSDAPRLDPVAKPALPRGVRLKYDEARGAWVLLAPERLLKLDAIAVEILKRCSGEASLSAIVDDLAASFDAPRDRIATDVEALLAGLVAKRLVDLA